MARKTINLPTTQEIERLYKSGDIEALRSINERLAKTANQRMAQLYKSKIETEALKNAKYFLEQESEVATGGVFSRSKKIEAEDLVDQLKQELKFLRSETSTVSGVKEIRADKVFTTLTEGKKDQYGNVISDPYLQIPENIKPPSSWSGSETEYFKKKFLAFLSSDAWKDIKKFLYTTNDNTLLREAGESIAAGAKLSDLNKAYQDYLSNEISIYDLWDDFTSIIR